MDIEARIKRAISRLRARGEVTILETSEGTTVALRVNENVTTLSNGDKNKLLIELEKMTRP